MQRSYPLRVEGKEVVPRREPSTPEPTLQEEAGQGLVEYAVILMLVAVVVIAVLGVIGHQTENVFSNVSHGISN